MNLRNTFRRSSDPLSNLHTRTRLRALIVLAVFLCASFVSSAPITPVALAATLPSGFTEVPVATGLTNATAFAIAPDGRIFVCLQGGQLRVVKNGALLATPFVTLSVDSNGERGLLGVAFDPNFAGNGYVYVYYTVPTAPIHNRVSRFTANGDVAVAGSETPILDLDNLSSATNHNGGAIHFGPDGKLYVAVGENANAANAQTLNNRLGKMLRINADGSLPTDNPFFNTATGANRAIWALGLRNPYTFNFKPGTQRMFINDVGQNTWEEINDGIAGSNYGWNTCEGNCSPPNANFRDPLYQFAHVNNACAITGGTFYNPVTTNFPAQYIGKYFFADFCANWIHTYDPTSGAVADFATGAVNPVDLQVGLTGSLYYLERGNSRLMKVDYGTPPPTALQYYPLAHPIRLLDTRAGFTACYAPGAPLAAGSTRTQAARGTCDGLTIPASALAITGNATVVANAGGNGGYVTLYSSDAPLPNASNLNFTAGQVVPNAFTVALGADGAFKITTAGLTHFIVDVTGYYAPPGTGGLYFHPLPAPVRLLDTRAGFQGCNVPGQPLQAYTDFSQLGRGTCTIPSDAQALVGNATVVNILNNSVAGYARLWPSGQAMPNVSNLNYAAGQVVPNAFTVGLGADGRFNINATSSTHFLVDVTGYYSASAAADANGIAGLLFTPMSSPLRLLETRAGFPGCDTPGAPLAGGTERTETTRTPCLGIPSSAQVVVGNATVVTASQDGYAILWPSGATQPDVSNLNYVAGQVVPNAFTVRLGASDGAFKIYVTGTTHFIVDLSGYFAP